MNAADTIADIERERRKRENELALALLLLSLQTRRYVTHAIKLYDDPLQAMRTVWLGSEHFRGAVTPLARAMADAHVAGFETATGLVHSTATAPEMVDLVRYYRGSAQEAAEQMLTTMQARVQDAMNEAREAGVDAKGTVDAVRQTFFEGGYTKEKPTALERASEANILPAYQDGFGAAMKPAVADGTVKGFRYIATIDDVTTPICRQYNGTKLAADHPWWRNHAPQNHWGCRSFYLPILTDFEPTAVPMLEPMPGFGFDALGPLVTPFQTVGVVA